MQTFYITCIMNASNELGFLICFHTLESRFFRSDKAWLDYSINDQIELIAGASRGNPALKKIIVQCYLIHHHSTGETFSKLPVKRKLKAKE